MQHQNLTVECYVHFRRESCWSKRYIRETTRIDPVLSQVLKYTLEGWPEHLDQSQYELKPYFNHKQHQSIEQGCILLGYRVIDPTKFRARLLDEIHNVISSWRMQDEGFGSVLSMVAIA